MYPYRRSQAWLPTIIAVFAIRTCDGFVPSSPHGRNSVSGSLLSPYICAVALATPSSVDDTRRDQWDTNPTSIANKELAALAKQISRSRNRVLKAKLGSQALRYFNSVDFEVRDTVTYNSILKVLSKVSPVRLTGLPAAHIADSILQDMKLRNEEQVAANEAFYESLKTAEPGTASPPPIRVEPNAHSYSTIMHAFARMGTDNSSTRVEELLEELESRYAEHNNPTLEPNIIVYNVVLAAFAKANKADAAIALLEDRMPVAPDRISYNTVLNALARSNQPQTAEDLLRRMHVPPNARSYAAVMDAWGRAGSPDKARALLDELTALYARTRDQYVFPNAVVYTTLIHSYALSKDPHKITKAQQVLDDMIAAGVRPNTLSYNSLLNCCATVGVTTVDTMVKAKEVYETILHEGLEDEATFSTILKACANHMEWERDSDFCMDVFREAITKGLVNSAVLRQFNLAVPVHVYRIFVPDEAQDAAALPAKWTRNAVVFNASGPNRKRKKPAN